MPVDPTEYSRRVTTGTGRNLTGPREVARATAGSWMGRYRSGGEPPRVICPPAEED